MRWIYLSPHADDVALSCGGVVWEQSRQGLSPQVWTICAGDPPAQPLSPFAEALHIRWNTGREAAAIRRAEDLQSCAQMGAWARHFPIPDCIYRRLETDGTAPYASEAEIFGPLHLGEADLVESLSAELAKGLTEQPVLICPLSLGGHVDHRLTRLAAERLDRSLWFYADYPYAEASAADLSGLIPEGWEMFVYPISAEGLAAWFRCVAAHRSQISTFWPDLDSMEASIQAYCRRHRGVRLWRERSTNKIGG